MHLEVYAFDSSFNTESIKPNQLKNDSGRFLPTKKKTTITMTFILALFYSPHHTLFGSLRYLSFSDLSEICDRLTMTKKGCHEWPPVNFATYFFFCRVVCTSQRRCPSNTSRCLQPSNQHRPSSGRHVLSTTAHMGLWENIEYYGPWGVPFERASKQASGEGSSLCMGNRSVWWKMDLCPHPSLRINVKKIMSHWPAKFYRRFYGEKQVSAFMAHNACEFGNLVDAIFKLFIYYTSP